MPINRGEIQNKNQREWLCSEKKKELQKGMGLFSK
jgi:hypothetical protein